MAMDRPLNFSSGLCKYAVTCYQDNHCVNRENYLSYTVDEGVYKLVAIAPAAATITLLAGSILINGIQDCQKAERGTQLLRGLTKIGFGTFMAFVSLPFIPLCSFTPFCEHEGA